MVEIRVAVEDVTHVPALMRRLATDFHRTSIAFDRSRKEVRIESDGESRAVGQVVEAVEAWLEENTTGSATLWMAGRSYRLATVPRIKAAR
jgi:hypothetical protein